MASVRGSIGRAAAIIGLALLCIFAYYALLYVLSPYSPHAGYPVPGNPPPGPQVSDSGTENFTPSQRAAYFHDTGTKRTVYFFHLPPWIRLSFLPWLLLVTLVPFIAALFTVRRAKIKDNDNKGAVLDFIKDNPGCTAPELARGNNLNIGTVRYHIKKLEEEGRIALAKIGKFCRIYPSLNTYDEREKLVASHLRNDSCRLILGALMETPGISNQKLSEKLGMEKSLAFRYLQKLREDGIVTCEIEGKSKLYYVDAAAKEALIKLMPLHYKCPGLKKG